MHEEAGQTGPRVRLQLAVALLALVVGMLVYLTDRAASHSMLMPNIVVHANLHPFGDFGQWLPTFVHSLAFSLISAAALQPGARPMFSVCFAWAALNVLFEIGQHPLVSTPVADALLYCEGWLPFARSISNYFVRGVFDTGDIVAAILGATAAASVLHLTHRRGEVRYAC